MQRGPWKQDNVETEANIVIAGMLLLDESSKMTVLNATVAMARKLQWLGNARASLTRALQSAI